MKIKPKQQLVNFCHLKFIKRFRKTKTTTATAKSSNHCVREREETTSGMEWNGMEWDDGSST